MSLARRRRLKRSASCRMSRRKSNLVFTLPLIVESSSKRARWSKKNYTRKNIKVKLKLIKCELKIYQPFPGFRISRMMLTRSCLLKEPFTTELFCGAAIEWLLLGVSVDDTVVESPCSDPLERRSDTSWFLCGSSSSSSRSNTLSSISTSRIALKPSFSEKKNDKLCRKILKTLVIMRTPNLTFWTKGKLNFIRGQNAS